jgi:hypothetical protein
MTRKKHQSRAMRQEPQMFVCREIPRPANVGLAVRPDGWGRLDLTFSVGAPPPGISDAVFRSAVQRALDIWGQAVPFRFTEDMGGGTLKVAGVAARHDDGFDFPPNTIELAHGFGPVTGSGTLDGQVHLNNTKTWADGTGADGDVLTIVLHELGHALGIIEHFGDAHTVMNATFPPGLIRRVLSPADVEAMRGLYERVLT